MGSSKTAQYSREQLSFARTAKAIGHPARVAIVQHLAEHGHETNKQLMKLTQLSDATIVQHLNELVSCGILSGVYVGNKHYYSLTQEAEKAVEALQLIFQGTGGVSDPVITGSYPR